MLSTAVTLGGGLGGLVAAEAEVSEGYVVAVAFGAVDRDCGYGSGRGGYAWRVGGGAAVQQQGIRAARIGGIGIIASLLLLRGRRHTLYALRFRYARPSTALDWTLWPALRALAGWIH